MHAEKDRNLDNNSQIICLLVLDEGCAHSTFKRIQWYFGRKMHQNVALFVLNREIASIYLIM